MVKLFPLYAAVLPAISRRIVPALTVSLPSLTSTATTARLASSCARSVLPASFPEMQTAFLPLTSDALTAVIPLFIRKTADLIAHAGFDTCTCKCRIYGMVFCFIRSTSPKQGTIRMADCYQLHGHLTRPRLVPTHRWKYHYDRMRFHRLKGTALHLGQALSLPCLGRVSMFLSDRIMAGCLYGSAHRNVSG